ncbi:MAG: SIR2 family protein [Bacteroidales bacterium]|jgi:hypothetical protein|nr:SIR2 family protein [Bacteroidales bacterium]
MKIKRGILFTGSGFSILANNINGKQLPTGRMLSKSLCELMQIDDDSDLQFTSSEFIRRNDVFKLIDLLKNEFTVNPDNCNKYKKISIYPWERIYTTNYDNVIETCAAKSGKKITPVTTLDVPSDYREKSHLSIHLNGYIDRLKPESLEKDFRLTTESFMWDDYNDKAWLRLFRQDIKFCDFILFIGFNILNDIDIRRSIFATRESREKIFIITQEDISENDTLKLERMGTVYAIGVDKFLDDFEGIEIDNSSMKKNIKLFVIEEKTKNDNIVNPIFDKDIFDLLLYGRIDDRLIMQSQKDVDSLYYFDRKDIIESIEHIKKPGASLVLHSNVANGKSFAASVIMQNFILNNYKVFYLDRIDENALKDIKFISTIEGNKLIIIENYNSFFWLFDDIADIFTDQSIRFIFTERTLVNDYAEDKLRQYFKNIESVDLNQLSHADFDSFNKYFEKYGIWGDFAGYSEAKRKEVVFNICNGNISLILLKIVNSDNIRSKLTTILKTVSDSSALFEILLLITFKDVFNYSMDYEEIEFILGDANLNKFKFNKSDEINELIEYSKNNIKIKSIVLSDLIINVIDNPGVMINLLLKIVIYSNKQYDDRYYSDILKKYQTMDFLQDYLKNLIKNNG